MFKQQQLVRQKKYGIPEKSSKTEVVLATELLNIVGYVKIINQNHDLQDSLATELQEKIDNKDLYITNEHFLMVGNPLYSCDSVLPLVINSTVLSILKGFFQCEPVYVGSNLRRSLLNSTMMTDGTTNFHRDREYLKFLKVFYYLNDVDMNGGPFTYVKNSFNFDLTQNHVGYNNPKHFTQAQIQQAYGLDSIINLTAKKGDIIIANTSGFHKGLKCETRIRDMLTITYSVFWNGKGGTPTIHSSKFNNLSQIEKRIFDFCEIIK